MKTKSFKYKKIIPKLKKYNLYSLLVYILLIDLCFVFLYPFIYMLATSMKSYNDIIDLTVKWIPKEFSPENWITAFKALNFKKTLFNSTFVSLFSTVGHILSCSFIAYGFARYKFPMRNVMFVCVLLTFIIPIQSIIIPQYRLYSQLKLINGYLPLILPTFLGFGLRGGLFIFLFRQFYIKLPSALEEAAEIDGANPYRTYFSIILPSSGSMTLVCFILSMVWHWNDYYEPSIYLSDSDKWLLPQTLPSMYSMLKAMENMTADDLLLKMTFHEGVAMAGTALCVIPLLILYLFFQNKFLESIERTGLVE